MARTTKSVNITLRPHEHERLKNIASRYGISVSSLIRVFIQKEAQQNAAQDGDKAE